MKNVGLMSFMLCAAAFGQTASDNVAGDALKKRMQTLNLFSVNPSAPRQIVLAGALAPKVCAIPLLSVDPVQTNDRMKIMTPHIEPRRGDTIQVPAPACK
jgi:hypothetical protein